MRSLKEILRLNLYCCIALQVLLCEIHIFIWHLGEYKKQTKCTTGINIIACVACSLKKQFTCFSFWKICQQRYLYLICQQEISLSWPAILSCPNAIWSWHLPGSTQGKQVSFNVPLTGSALPLLELWELLSTDWEPSMDFGFAPIFL